MDGDQKKRRSFKRSVFRLRTLYILGGLIILTSLIVLVYSVVTKKESIVNEAGEVVSTKVDYKDNSIRPASALPSGYTVSPDSPVEPEDAEGVIITELIAAGKPTIYISQQPLPPNFDFNAFFQNISSLKEIETELGKASYGVSKIDRSWVASIQSGSEWILVNSAETLPEADFVQATKSLKKP